MLVTLKLVSNLSPFLNCWVAWYPVPIYQTPPPSFIPLAIIDPEVPLLKGVVVVLVAPCTEKFPIEEVNTDWLFPATELVVTVTLVPKDDPDKINILVDSLNEAVTLFKDEDKEILEDLLIAAINDAKEKGEIAAQEEMKSLTGGLPLPPGMKLPF